MEFEEEQGSNLGAWIALAVAAVVAIVLILGIMLGWPHYRVYANELRGKATLREAEWNRQVLVEEAEAMKLAELTRAEGVAEANRIIGESLEGNDEYLRYLWIQGLHDGNSEVIYVPTEANLPILEAGQR